MFSCVSWGGGLAAGRGMGLFRIEPGFPSIMVSRISYLFRVWLGLGQEGEEARARGKGSFFFFFESDFLRFADSDYPLMHKQKVARRPHGSKEARKCRRPHIDSKSTSARAHERTSTRGGVLHVTYPSTKTVHNFSNTLQILAS